MSSAFVYTHMNHENARTFLITNLLYAGRPGRLIDLVKMKGTNLARCTYVVLDEADRYSWMEHKSESISNPLEKLKRNSVEITPVV